MQGPAIWPAGGDGVKRSLLRRNIQSAATPRHLRSFTAGAGQRGWRFLVTVTGMFQHFSKSVPPLRTERLAAARRASVAFSATVADRTRIRGAVMYRRLSLVRRPVLVSKLANSNTVRT